MAHVFEVCKSVICYGFLPLTDFCISSGFFYVTSSFCYLKSPVQFWKGGLYFKLRKMDYSSAYDLTSVTVSVTMGCSLFRKYRIKFL